MEKEKIRSLILSPVMEDVLIGINFLNGVWCLADMRELFPEGKTAGKFTWYVEFLKPHLGMQLQGYRVHRALHFTVHMYGVHFWGGDQPTLPHLLKKWEQL